MSLTLVIVAKSHRELDAFPMTNVMDTADEVVLLANSDKRFGGTGVIGNYTLDNSRCDVVGIVHADTSFGPGALRAFEQEAMGGGVVGIVGKGLDGRYIWCHEVDQVTPVSTLDSCSIFVRRSTKTRFDAQLFDSFHCCVEDFCLASGEPILVPPAVANHLGVTTFAPHWQAEYWGYREKLQSKWGRLIFATT